MMAIGPTIAVVSDAAASAWDINWAILGITIGAFVGAAFAGWRATRAPDALDDGPLLHTNLLDEDLPLRPETRLMGAFGTVLLLLLGVYIVFDRAGAWVHIPGTPLFIGELTIVLGLVAMASMRLPIGRAIRSSPALKALVFWMAWGAALLVPAISRYGIDAIRDSALWYYGIAAVFTTSLLISNPGRVGRWLGLYRKVMPYILFLFPIKIVVNAMFSDIAPNVPFTSISILSHKNGNIAVLTAIFLAYIWLVDSEKRAYTDTQRTVFTAGGVLVILLAGMQNRGGMVAAAVGLGIAMVLMRRRRSDLGLVMGGVFVIALTLALISNFSVPLFGGRSVSAEQLITNVTSVIQPGTGTTRETGTVTWRLDIWGRVLDDVASDSPIMGFGPGPDLGELYGVGGEGEVTLRNPHNSHVGVLARMGFVGAVAWAGVWSVWAMQLLLLRQRLNRRGREQEGSLAAWLVASAATILVNAIFDPTLEGPQVAILLWTLFGLGAAAPLLYAGFESTWLDDTQQPQDAAALR